MCTHFTAVYLISLSYRRCSCNQLQTWRCSHFFGGMHFALPLVREMKISKIQQFVGAAVVSGRNKSVAVTANAQSKAGVWNSCWQQSCSCWKATVMYAQYVAFVASTPAGALAICNFRKLFLFYSQLLVRAICRYVAWTWHAAVRLRFHYHLLYFTFSWPGIFWRVIIFHLCVKRLSSGAVRVYKRFRNCRRSGVLPLTCLCVCTNTRTITWTTVDFAFHFIFPSVTHTYFHTYKYAPTHACCKRCLALTHTCSHLINGHKYIMQI